MGQSVKVNYAKYYQNRLEESAIYVDFVVDVAWSMLGLAIVQYGSKAYQTSVGESRTGVEIKHDWLYSTTGNLWIEGAEKKRPRDGPYFPSGIYRTDNTWLYCIGDYDTIFFFAKKFLRALYESGKYKIQPNKTETSLGFLMPSIDANRYSAAILKPHASEKVAKFTADLSRLGKELHAVAKLAVEGKNQLSLFEQVGVSL